MTSILETNASTVLCPAARMFAAGPSQEGCRGRVCAAWRWTLITTGDRRWQAALRARMIETGETDLRHPKAAALAKDDVTPDKGYCGLGGEVQA